jgi:hypothetical protein
MLPTKFRFIWPSGFRDFLEIDQSETRIACSGNVCKRIRMKEGPLSRCSFRLDPSQTWPPQESLVSDWLISKKKFCTETAHLSKQFQRRRFLEMYQSETRIACGGDVYSQNQDIHIIL